MKTKIKTALLTAFVCFGLLSSLQAQDKYEFATVTQLNNQELHISIEGKSYEKQLLSKDIKSLFDYTKLLEYVSKMQSEGWEVFNTQVAGISTNVSLTFILRKKKN